jgi:hypothetical protein
LLSALLLVMLSCLMRLQPQFGQARACQFARIDSQVQTAHFSAGSVAIAGVVAARRLL